MAVSITGTIQDASGNPVESAVIRLSPASPTVGGAEALRGVGIIDNHVEVLTDALGRFEIDSVDFFRYRLEIPSIGYDREFVAPNHAVIPTIRFHLLGLRPEVQTVVRGEKRVSATTNTFITEVTVKTENIATVKERFNQLELERSEVSAAGPYLPFAIKKWELLDNTFYYDMLDKTEDKTYFYRARYSNILSPDVSAFGDVVSSEGQGPSALLVSVDELRENYLFGLDLSDDSGKPFPDRMLEWYINAAISWLHLELDIDLVAKTHVRETHDHYAYDYARWGYFQLDNYPVVAVDELAFQYPTMNHPVVIDPQWIVLEDGGVSGVLQILPGQGNIADVLMIPGALLPMWTGATGRVPAIWHCTYRSGFEPLTAPADIKHVIAMYASIGVLNIAGDLIVGAGIASKSVSIPGLSQNVNTTSSATNAGFGARIIEYQKEIKEMLPNLRRFYGKATRMVVI